MNVLLEKWMSLRMAFNSRLTNPPSLWRIVINLLALIGFVTSHRCGTGSILKAFL